MCLALLINSKKLSYTRASNQVIVQGLQLELEFFFRSRPRPRISYTHRVDNVLISNRDGQAAMGAT